MNEYRQNAINHLKTHLGCVGYRDYIVAELQKLEEIENIITETENQHYELQGEKVVMNSLAYGKIKGGIENG